MEHLLNLGSIAAGVAALYYGAEWLIRGSSGIALRLGVPPLVIGLTIVAIGTSSPELFVCVLLNLSGNADTAVGNIVGSNICNILLILGFSAVIKPILVKSQLISRDSPVLIAVTLAFVWMAYDGTFALWEGIVLVTLTIAYLYFSFRLAKTEKNPEVIREIAAEIESLDAVTDRPHGLALMSAFIVAGIAVLVAGSHFLKVGALAVAHQLGVSDAIIGLTLVAVGTSLPELATSIVASARGEGDIITGNAIGSSIFNILSVLGIMILVRPTSFAGIERMDVYFMLGSAALAVPLMWTRRRLDRREGALLLGAYLVYCVLLAQRA